MLLTPLLQLTRLPCFPQPPLPAHSCSTWLFYGCNKDKTTRSLLSLALWRLLGLFFFCTTCKHAPFAPKAHSCMQLSACCNRKNSFFGLSSFLTQPCTFPSEPPVQDFPPPHPSHLTPSPKSLLPTALVYPPCFASGYI